LDWDTARRLIERLNLDAERLARRFGLRYRSITAERAGVRSRYGVCYADGAIKIRLRHVTTGRPLKYSSLVNTLCHELAHLRYFNHGLRFRAFYGELLDYARREGIYRPGRTEPALEAWAEPSAQPARKAPRAPDAQLTLF
jgi:predicted metal-dependent hydrolase